MVDIKTLELDLKVVIGEARLTMGDIMRLGRGSVIRLTDPQSSAFERAPEKHRLALSVNDHTIGDAVVTLNGADVGIEITDWSPPAR